MSVLRIFLVSVYINVVTLRVWPTGRRCRTSSSIVEIFPSFFFVAEQHYMAWGLGKGVPSGVGKFGAQRQSLSVADPVHERETKPVDLFVCGVGIY